MTRMSYVAVGGLLAVVGCSGGPKFAPVSGVVTLNGQPYPNAVVTFQPIGTQDNPNPGRGSSAYTDENGRFVLICDGDVNGAVVGKHLVRIATKGMVAFGEPGVGSADDAHAQAGRMLDPIPPEWNSQSEKEFDVPPKGTDKANFDILNPHDKGPAGR